MKLLANVNADLKKIDSIGAGLPFKRAMIDLKATHRERSNYSGAWKHPKLTSRTGVHQHGSQTGKPQWYETTFPGKKNFEVGKLSLMKRGDHPNFITQYPTAVRI